MIYLNNAATTQQKPEGVKNARSAKPEQAKMLTAKLFGMKNPENVILTHGGRQAVELALRTFIEKGDHVIVSVLEQDATWKVIENMAAVWGIEFSTLGVNGYGTLRYEDVEGLIRPNTRAVVCAHGCSVTGNVVDMERLCTIARRHNLLVISDGCQTAGAMDVDLEELGIDVYCFTGHKKLMGPHGIGGMCVKEGLMEQFRHGLPGAFEGNPALAEILEPIDGNLLGGFCRGLEFIAEKGIYGIAMLPHRLAKRFFESVKSMDAVQVIGDFGTNVRIPTISIAVEGFTAHQVKAHLSKKFGIVVKDGLHDAERMHEALGIGDGGLTRFSFGYFNTRRDVNDAVWALMDLLGLDDLYLLS